ncbi:Retinoic acid-induced protein 1 [Liparis tanakae]|uniref:Retinoic acid-induced protein 1 n=1 Tax=Liparis tanakae TaxID=230148 RepID=A0A4Z2GH27_9TELE|nr:Retinoic acid-induced protein 1 [Liparis tanakae]
MEALLLFTSTMDAPLMAMDLSTGFSVKPLPRDHGEALDLATKPEWFHRRPPPGCGAADLGSPYRPRDASSYGARRPRPEPGEEEPGPESLGNRYMNSTLAPGLDLCRDGVHGGLWHPGFYGPDPTGGEAIESSGGSGAGGEESDSGSDVIFLVSSTAEPALCGSFLQDGVRRGVQEEEGGRGRLTRPPSSPSPDSLSADASEGVADIPVRHARPVVLLSDLAAVYANAAASPVNISSDDDDDDSDVIEVSPPLPPRSPARETPPPSDGEKRLRRREVRRSNRIRRPASDTPPASCGGGKASRHSLRRRAKSDAVGIYNESGDSDAVMDFAVTLCGSDEDEKEEEEEEEEAASRPDENERVGGNSEESDAGEESPQRKSPERRPPRGKVSDASGEARKRAAPGGPREAPGARTKRRQSRGAKAPKPRETKTNKKPAARRRRRGGGGRQPAGPSNMFGPREPEITLKYANVAKRRSKKAAAAFCPFVHAKETTCTVVNDQEEEEAVRSGRRRPGAGAGPPSGFVPGTTCYRLCRYAADGERPAPPLCCLCGQTANAAGLGDLHGPYRPANPAPPPVSRRSVNASEDGDDGGGDGSDCGAASGVSLPAPARLDEGWIHEDCGVWSAGVFLVRGKLYGLEEAARIAQETVIQQIVFCSRNHFIILIYFQILFVIVHLH